MRKSLWVVLAVGLVVTLINPVFLHLNNVISILYAASFVGIICLAEMLVMLDGGVDISVGAMDFTSNSAVTSMAALDYYQIPYTGLVTPGDCHTWYFWRAALYKFLSEPLFKIN